MAAGFLNVLKPPGMSSHDVVGAARKIFGVKRVGHAGTLDPAAAGVLPVAVGRAARFIEYLSAVDKSYIAELKLGEETDSGDDTGQVVAKKENFSLPTLEEIEAALAQFRGQIRQTPPAHSAIKIQGQRAYDLTRKQEAVTMPEREVTISRLELTAYRPEAKKLLLSLDCSKGTYVRSLCRDIGRALGIPATMSFLVRTRVGDFSLAASFTLEEIKSHGQEALMPPETCLSHLPRVELPLSRRPAFCRGLGTTLREKQLDAPLLVFGGSEFWGVGSYNSRTGELKPTKVFISE
ncbi:MAG: tRNA pseudouridine(55) synthase TruB [Selenomonadaceae bacterium]|nr:tRNA pseudouridine(55) synthase TruB [Selenomonadaceae bacterium]